jgi:hypothetical protein
VKGLRKDFFGGWEAWWKKIGGEKGESGLDVG